MNIVATVSDQADQGSTKVATINELIEKTHQYCLKNKIENQYNGYLVCDQDIIHIYDPPHLLKSIRNNLLTKNVKFNWYGKERIAS